MSVALAVIGEMLNAAEYALERAVIHDGRGLTYELAVSRLDTLREARDRIVAAEGLTYTLPDGQRVIGSLRREPLPSDAEVREMLRNDRELMADEMHGRDIDGSLRW